MSDRKQTNKYYPPSYDPLKGSLNTQLGQHVLRKRASRLSEGVLVVRFEMPFNVWCSHCEAHIGKGVRYNADKQQVAGSEAGSAKYPLVEGWKSGPGGLFYFSTKVWQFSMPCHLCHKTLVVRTDPKRAQYDMHSGVRAKDESFTAAQNESVELLSTEERARVRTDALFALEHGEKDKQAAAAEHTRLGDLFRLNEHKGGAGGDFLANARLRAGLRGARKADAHATAIGAARGISIPLLPVSEEDALRSELVEFRPSRERVQQQQQLKRMKIREGDIFSGMHAGAAAASASVAASSTAAAAAASSSSAAVSASSSSSAAPPSARARAIQLALDTGIDVRALAPLPHAPAALYASGPATLMGGGSMPVRRVQQAEAAASKEAKEAQAAARVEPRGTKRKQAAATATAGLAHAPPQPSPLPAVDGGALGLSAYDSD